MDGKMEGTKTVSEQHKLTLDKFGPYGCGIGSILPFLIYNFNIEAFQEYHIHDSNVILLSAIFS